MNTNEQLVGQSVRIASAAAVRLLKSKGIRPNEADKADLAASIKDEVKGSVADALRDAEEALDCFMEDVARDTYIASMVLAGHRAVEQVYGCDRLYGETHHKIG